MTHSKCLTISLFVIATLLAACVLPDAYGQVSGRMKIQQADGKWVTGEVEETPDAYIVTVGRGITVTIRKTEVRAIMPAEEPASQAAEGQEEESENPDALGGVRDADIEKLLEGTDLGTPLSALELEEGELPLNEESVEEMKQLVGATDVVATKHVVVVYTTSRKAAADLAQRLESVWRWNIRYMRMFKLPVRLPEHKLELYYLASREEFDAMCTNLGMGVSPGMLGFFTPEWNRSHFYDMLSTPRVKARLEAAKRADAATRRREEGLAKAWAEYQTLEVTQHELGHHIHSNIGLFPHYAYIARESWDAMPTWLVEGVTMQFEVPPGREGASLGAMNHERLAQFRQLYPKPSPDFMKMFFVNNAVWHSAFYYPMGWAVVYYMREEMREGLAKYHQIIMARDPGDAVGFTQRQREFEDCFGKIDQEWVDKFWKFMTELHLKRSLLPPEKYP